MQITRHSEASAAARKSKSRLLRASPWTHTTTCGFAASPHSVYAMRWNPTEIVKRLFAWLERNARAAREREIESYLAQATDAADLENRMRRLERR